MSSACMGTVLLEKIGEFCGASYKKLCGNGPLESHPGIWRVSRTHVVNHLFFYFCFLNFGACLTLSLSEIWSYWGSIDTTERALVYGLGTKRAQKGRPMQISLVNIAEKYIFCILLGKKPGEESRWQRKTPEFDFLALSEFTLASCWWYVSMVLELPTVLMC